ncbi:MAG: hypothetical protein J6J36_07110 [Clostridia bacterium]|nr:hypothetical protein [Clostridia bacterium]
MLEREERKEHSKEYNRPGLAGAFYRDGKTYLTNGYWGVIADGEIAGLVMAEGEHPDVEKLLGDFVQGSDWKETDNYDNFPKYQVEMLTRCFTKYKIYVGKILVIKGEGGVAFVMPLRKNGRN